MKNSVISFLVVWALVCGSLTFLFIFAPMNVSAKTVYVDASHIGPEDGSQAFPYNTIQEGIDNANPGDTVYVLSGIYYENVVVDITINLTGEDRDTTVINGGGSGDVVSITANWVNVTGFTVTGSGTGSWDGGIKLSNNVQNCEVINNNATSNRNGILLYQISNNNIINNYVYSNDLYGIYLYNSIGSNIMGNTMIEDGISILGNLLVHWNTHYIDDLNTVNGKPVYYLKNQIGGTVPGGAGQVILANCMNVKVENQKVTHGSFGVELGFSSNNNITGNNASNNWIGIHLYSSSENDIIGNIASISRDGIYLQSSSENNIIGNTASSNIGVGIDLWSSSNDNKITGNSLMNNQYGIYLTSCSGNNITGNTVSLNTQYGISIASSGNTIYHNSFTDNNMQAYGGISGTVNQWDNGWPSGGNHWSDWDEPTEGAYDDYTGADQNVPDADGDGIVDQGPPIGGKNPYPILGGSGNVDNYPLMESVDKIPPLISDVTAIPDPQDSGGNVNISAIVTDNHQLFGVWVDIYDPDDNPVGNFSMSYDPINDRYYFNTIYLIIGVYNFTIWANDTSDNWASVSGTFVIQISWDVDYFVIRSESGGKGDIVTTGTYSVWEIDEFYAAAYNNTEGYLFDVEVIWLSDDPSVGQVDSPGIWTNFTAQWVDVDSLCNVTAIYNATINNATGVLTVLAPRVDYIQIRTEDSGGGINLCDPANWPSYVRSTITTFYGAEVNNTVGYIGSVPMTSTWTSNNTNVVNVTTPGNTTTVTCNTTNSGWVWVTLNDGNGHINQTKVTVLEWKVDYLLIRDASSGGGHNLCDPANYTYATYPVGKVVTFYGGAYNHTQGYIGDVDIGSTWFSSNSSIVSVSSPGSYSTITCNITNWGTSIITLDDGQGHQNATQVTVLEPTIDYIQIRDVAGGIGNIVTTGVYIVSEVDEFYAAGYNNTAGYLKDVEVIWSSSDTSVGQVDSPGTWTNFTAQRVDVDSTCNVTANYNATISNSTGLLTVLAPTVDYIQIRDTPGGMGDIVTTETYSVNDIDVFYAAAYNDTSGYLFDVEVVWSSDDTSVGQVTSLGIWTNFTAQKVNVDGTCTVTATYMSSISNSTGLLTVLAPTVDYIQIRDTPGGAGDIVTTGIYSVSDTDEFYAAAYNGTSGYLYNVEVVWSSDNTAVGQVTSPGIWTNFTAQHVSVDSTSTVTATYLGSISNSTGLLTVFAPNVDYILIRDIAGGEGNIVTTGTYAVNDIDVFYAAGYNDTSGYLFDVEVKWSCDDTSVGQVTSLGVWTNFTALRVSADSTCTVTAEYGIISDSTGLLMVLAPKTDYVQIRSASGGLGIALSDPGNYPSYPVGFTTILYGARCNNTIGYLEGVSSSSTWESSSTDIASVSNYGSSTALTCDNENWGTITITLTDVENDLSNTTQVTVLEPTADSLKIMDKSGGLGSEVIDPTYFVGATDIYHGAMFNDTAGYIGDVPNTATWTSNRARVTVTSPGSSATITCSDTDYGTATVTLDDGSGHKASTVVEILAPTIDHIQIQEDGGSDGNPITDHTINLGESETYYAVGYNETAGYLGAVEVDWSNTNSNLGGLSSSHGSQNTFSAVTDKIGDTTISASYNGNEIGSFVVTVVDSIPPVADAGYDREIEEGEEIELDGSSSDDNIGIESYEWVIKKDGTVIYTDDIEITYYEFSEPGTYEITLEVTDTSGNSDTDTITVTVKEKRGEAEQMNWLWLIILIIIIIVIILLLLIFLLGKRKKKDDSQGALQQVTPPPSATHLDSGARIVPPASQPSYVPLPLPRSEVAGESRKIKCPKCAKDFEVTIKEGQTQITVRCPYCGTEGSINL